jgi:hypothetical protein
MYAERLTAFARHTLAHGVRLAYHHHMGAYVETPADVDKLMALVGDEVGLLFDSGHMTFAGGDAPAMLAKYVRRVCHVHCKDVRPNVIKQARNGNWSFLQAVINGAFTVPGDGAIDFRPLLQLLYDNNYEGWLVVEAEQDPAVAPSYRYAEKGYRHLHDLVAEGVAVKICSSKRRARRSSRSRRSPPVGVTSVRRVSVAPHEELVLPSPPRNLLGRSFRNGDSAHEGSDLARDRRPVSVFEDRTRTRCTFRAPRPRPCGHGGGDRRQRARAAARCRQADQAGTMKRLRAARTQPALRATSPQTARRHLLVVESSRRAATRRVIRPQARTDNLPLEAHSRKPVITVSTRAGILVPARLHRTLHRPGPRGRTTTS